MYTRPPDRPFHIPAQYSGNAFSRDRAADGVSPPRPVSAEPPVTGADTPVTESTSGKQNGTLPHSSPENSHVRAQKRDPSLPSLFPGEGSRPGEDLLLLGILSLLSAERNLPTDGSAHDAKETDEVREILLLIGLLLLVG